MSSTAGSTACCDSLYLTGDARELVSQGLAITDAHDTEALSALGETDREKLIELLERVARAHEVSPAGHMAQGT